MEGGGAKTVLLSLTGQSRASAVVNVDGAVCFEGGRGELELRPQRAAGAQTGCEGRRRGVSWRLQDGSESDDDKAELRGSGSAGVFDVGTATDALGNEGQVAG